ncbi:hypothetical protein B296_00032615 [Ensete ventricosum]|uniref:Uncharacterized protein n=1 Tax=Ensete ventricosum TaxID=4639 RepID=A0A426XES8_ENSVE|nr:hypothetical protein B296_00032615 [Ensete ventricosum]
MDPLGLGLGFGIQNVESRQTCNMAIAESYAPSRRCKYLCKLLKEKREHLWNEYMHFVAQVQMEKMYTKRSEQDPNPINDGETFTMLEFAFIPLKAQQDKEMEIAGKNIWWRAMHGFRKQNRPFLIGTLQETGIMDEHQWKHPDNKPAGEATWAEPGETPYYATWPVQAYCDTFFVSNGLLLSCVKGKPFYSIDWWKGEDNDPVYISYWGKRPRTVLKITLKVTGGTIKCKSGSSEPDLLDEEWADEDFHANWGVAEK